MRRSRINQNGEDFQEQLRRVFENVDLVLPPLKRKTQLKLGLELMVDACLFHDGVRGMPRLDAGIDRERLAGKRTVPDVVITFSTTLESTSVLFKDPFD